MGAVETEQGIPDDGHIGDLYLAGLGLVKPKMPPEWTVSLGECNEQLSERFGISRLAQDDFVLRSHQRVYDAWTA